MSATSTPRSVRGDRLKNFKSGPKLLREASEMSDSLGPSRRTMSSKKSKSLPNNDEPENPSVDSATRDWANHLQWKKLNFCLTDVFAATPLHRITASLRNIPHFALRTEGSEIHEEEPQNGLAMQSGDKVRPYGEKSTSVGESGAGGYEHPQRPSELRHL